LLFVVAACGASLWLNSIMAIVIGNNNAYGEGLPFAVNVDDFTEVLYQGRGSGVKAG
jgi:hypothetical protein